MKKKLEEVIPAFTRSVIPHGWIVLRKLKSIVSRAVGEHGVPPCPEKDLSPGQRSVERQKEQISTAVSCRHHFPPLLGGSTCLRGHLSLHDHLCGLRKLTLCLLKQRSNDEEQAVCISLVRILSRIRSRYVAIRTMSLETCSEPSQAAQP